MAKAAYIAKGQGLQGTPLSRRPLGTAKQAKAKVVKKAVNHFEIAQRAKAGEPVQDQEEIPTLEMRETRLPESVVDSILVDTAGGTSPRVVARRYGVGESVVQGLIQRALSNDHGFVSAGRGREMLRALLLENSLALNVRVGENIDNLRPMEQVQAASLLTQRVIDLERASAPVQEVPDHEKLDRIGDALSKLATLMG